MFRRSTALLVSTFMAAAVLGVSPAVAAPGTAADATAAKAAAKPAKPSKKCKVRQSKPRKTVASKRFARCTVKAMTKGRTVQLRSRYDDGSWNKGPARFTKKTTDASVTYSNGDRLVVIGTDAWLKEAGKPWVKGKKNGTEDEQVTWLVRQLWLATASPSAYRGYLRSSRTGWTWTGRSKKINGVRAKEYVGEPKILGYRPDHYAVWVDKWDRPVRVDSTTTIGGITSSGRQTFSRWSKKVTIKAPRV